MMVIYVPTTRIYRPTYFPTYLPSKHLVLYLVTYLDSNQVPGNWTSTLEPKPAQNQKRPTLVGTLC
jgi:hypothetical protein